MEAFIETGHSEAITHLAVDHVHKLAATCSLDCSIKLFDIANKDIIKKVCTLPKGHDGAVFQASFSHPFSGRYLASCGIDRKVVIYKYDKESDAESENWKIDFSYDIASSSVNSLAFSPYQYGTKLIAACSEGKLLLFSKSSESWTVEIVEEDVQVGSLAICWAPATAVGTFQQNSSGQGHHLVQRFAVGGLSPFLRIYELSESSGGNKWKLAYELGEHSEWIRAISWCPILLGRNKSQLAVGLHNGQVVMWTYDDITRSWSIEVVYKAKCTWTSSLSFSSCGSMLSISFANNQTVVLKRNFNLQWKKSTVKFGGN